MVARNLKYTKNTLKGTAYSLLIVALSFWLLKAFFPTYKVQGVSMMPTIQPNSEQSTITMFGDIERHGIYLIDSSDLSTENVKHPEGPYMKRVIGTPGDTISLSLVNGAVVSINGQQVNKVRASDFRSFSMTSKKPETLGATFANYAFMLSVDGQAYPVYLPDPEAFNSKDNKLQRYTQSFFKFPWLEQHAVDGVSTIKIPEGYYFVISDNRVAGTDSRHFGLVPKRAFKNKVSIKQG